MLKGILNPGQKKKNKKNKSHKLLRMIVVVEKYSLVSKIRIEILRYLGHTTGKSTFQMEKNKY